MIKAIVMSKVSGRVVEGLFTARQLLDTYEEDLVLSLTACGCQPVGETYVVDCRCDEEWDGYELELIEIREDESIDPS
jgi:hypothetical protein